MKLIVIGDAAVGKSSLISAFKNGRKLSGDPYFPTIGIDFLQTTEKVVGETVNLQIWDTAGQERFRSITRCYVRGAQGVLISYDCTCVESFNHLRGWISELAVESVPMVVVGNKADLEDKTEVAPEIGAALGAELGAPFFSCSAKSGRNVRHAFLRLAELAMEAQGVKEEDTKMLDHSAETLHCCYQ